MDRTVRMLEEAKRLTTAGETVYVMVENEVTATTLRSAVGSVERLHFAVAGNRSLRGIKPSNGVTVLVDPAVIEDRYAEVLAMLRRFDEPRTDTERYAGYLEGREAAREALQVSDSGESSEA